MQEAVEVNKDNANEVSIEERRLALKSKREETKFDYRKERRPVAWLLALLLIDLAIIILAIAAIGIFGQSSFVGTCSTYIAVAFGIIFIGLTIYFFLDYDSYGHEYGFKAIERIKELISLKEDIEKLQIQLRILEEHIAAHRSFPEKDLEKLHLVIQQYQRRANHNRWYYYILQMVIIFCSLLVTGLTSGLTGLVAFFRIPWITPAFSFAVSFLTAMITLFRFRERGHNLQQTADAIEFESTCYKKGIFGYKDLRDNEAYTKFAEEVERLINEQRKRQQQLEQSSETKHTTE